MRLYRHSTLCRTAMQMFLNCNPQYWCFVPVNNMDADNDDIVYTQMGSPTINIISHHYSYDENYLDEKSAVSVTAATDVRSDEETQWLVDNLPVPPLGYRFTQRQRYQQYTFFKNKQDLFAPPSSHLDLYNATIVFVCT